MEENKSSKLKNAGLASAFGAGVLGFGLGAFLGDYVGQYSILIMLIGLVMHSWGMYAVHQSKKGIENPVWWSDLLYWLCWIVLIGLAIYILVKSV